MFNFGYRIELRIVLFIMKQLSQESIQKLCIFLDNLLLSLVQCITKINTQITHLYFIEQKLNKKLQTNIWFDGITNMLVYHFRVGRRKIYIILSVYFS